jgi:predicted double-glycine peptidase
MGRSRPALRLCWFPFLILVAVGTGSDADNRCVFGSMGRSIAVHHDVQGGQATCAVVYHKPPAPPSVVWTGQSDVDVCEEKADDLVRTLERGGWSCEGIPGLAPREALQALIGGSESDRAQAETAPAVPVGSSRTVAAEVPAGMSGQPRRDLAGPEPAVKAQPAAAGLQEGANGAAEALRARIADRAHGLERTAADAIQALIAGWGSGPQTLANGTRPRDGSTTVAGAGPPAEPAPLPGVVPRFKPEVTGEAVAAGRSKGPGRVAEAAGAMSVVAAPPKRFGPAEARVFPAALVEPDRDPPYEVDDLPSGSSAVAPARGQVRSLLEIRRDKVVVQQWDFSCGAAALATILNYQHGDPVTERQVAKGLIARKEYLENPDLVRTRFGFSLLDLKRYVDERGYEGIGYGDLTLEDLIERAPIMVPVDFNGYNHFVVFRGKMGNRVLLADPAYGNRTMRARDFEAAWLDYPKFGKVGFVVARLDGLAPPNELAPLPDDFVMVN